MQITKLRTNHLENPLGFSTELLTLSWVTEAAAGKQTGARVEIASDPDFAHILLDTGMSPDISGIAYTPDLALSPRTRYYWRVTVAADNGETAVSAPAWFETGKRDEAWTAKWIAAPFGKDVSPLIRTTFSGKDVVSARVYVCGLGTYELYMNGEKVSADLLAPGHHSYDLWLQAFAYDLTPYLQEENAFGALLTAGWYKGRFGFDGGFSDIYGDTMRMIAEIHLTMKDGSEVVLGSDESWTAKPSPIVKSAIYYGEDYDARLADPDWATIKSTEGWESCVAVENDLGALHDRYSPAVTVHEKTKPVEVLHTPKDEYVLDFGQNMAGWIEIDVPAMEPGSKVVLSYSEVMQDDCFYRDNLRTAECQYTYISDGKPAHIRPHGTFYGFRFAKVEGMEADPAAFTACTIHSDIEQTGWIETDDPALNRLVKNALWGQKSNFLDVPTDCPQRDERMGWTGDAQIFAGTACFNMYTPAFYAKYMEDLAREQSLLDGGIPFVIPVIKPKAKSDADGAPNMFAVAHSSTAWGDVACVLPWTLYQYYGDKEMLRRHYPAMKGWVHYMYTQDEKDGGKRLWQTGFHFADWLALDNYKDPEAPVGATDCYYIASAYYAYSTSLTAQAARVLGEDEDAEKYEQLVKEIKAAMLREYFSPNGRCTIDTQTARVVALYFGIVPEEMQARQLEDLKGKLRVPLDHRAMMMGEKPVYPPKVELTTGFVGTPYLCPTLSKFGDLMDAYSLLLKTDYPSWLYEVSMGATTVWERWNSILPDGHISGTGMNSLNHYSYGSIVEWMYRYMCGLNQTAPGFKKVRFQPMPDPENRVGKAKMAYDSASGRYECGWEKGENGYTYTLTVPFDCEAEVILPGGHTETVGAGSYTFNE